MTLNSNRFAMMLLFLAFLFISACDSNNRTTTKAVQSPQVPERLSREKYKAGERKVVTINGVEFAFRWCPAGTFMMGSPSSEKGHNADEKRHQVTLSKGFWIMETEVTQKQWNVIMKKNRSCYKGDDLPVENVSWNDCQEFCNNCEQLDLPVQLPTEAQWEYACRAGSSTPYFWGDLLDGVQANCDGHFGHELFGKKGKKIGTTTPVGSYSPNAWGLYDMHGNVSEWCADRFSAYSGKSETDPTGPSTGFVRVTRGGFFDSPPSFCRSASRKGINEKARSLYIGFRCALNE